jgi:hypothetical protein
MINIVVRSWRAVLFVAIPACLCTTVPATVMAQVCTPAASCDVGGDYTGSFSYDVTGPTDNILVTDGTGTDPSADLGLTNLTFSDNTNLTTGHVFGGAIDLSDDAGDSVSGRYYGYLNLMTGNFDLTLIDLVGAGDLAGDIGFGDATGNANLTDATFTVTIDARLVPEPASLTIFGAALAMFGAIRARQLRRPAITYVAY